MKRIIYHKDNLDILRGLNSESVDLIYLDPPFNKKKTFSAPIGSTAEGASFSDIFREEDVKDEWVQEIKAEYYGLYTYLNSIRDISEKKGKHYLYNYCYLCYMAIRLIEMKRILKNTGSIYYHCDQTMSHYIKILMDIIFGEKNFRNEIVWFYPDTPGRSKKFFPRKTDTIFFYSKNDAYVFCDKEIRVPILEESKNRYKTVRVLGGKEYLGGETATIGKIPENVWRFPSVKKNSKESTGYPTQKPLKLLERIIQASSNEGDLVLDPFCGCATTCVAAEKLGRNWIGIDVSHKAYELVQKRIKRECPPKLGIEREEVPVEFTAVAPKRTDIGTDLPKKYVYVMSHPMYRGYKVGIASNVKSRLSSYKTAHMDRNCKFEFTFQTPYYKEIETYIHNKYTNYHEWVAADLKELISEIKNYEKNNLP